jgi:hypothetical protein
MEDVAADGALADVACTPDLEAQLDKSVAGSTVGPICRICLSAGSAEQELIQPCACAGTVGYVHAACLTAWVQEKGSLTCEICQQHYKAPFVQAVAALTQPLQQQQLTADVEQGREQRPANRNTCCGWLLNAPVGQWICLM